MKCITLWQPWASLLFSPGEFRKEFETRPRKMGFKPGETIAIHAAITLDGFRAFSQIPPADRVLIHESLLAQFQSVERGELWENVVPFGAIIGTLKVIDIVETIVIADVITDRERAFGDFRDGRVAIATAEPKAFETPIEWTGQQGVFFVPDNVIARAT